MKKLLFIIIGLLFFTVSAKMPDQDSTWFSQNYTKHEYRIPMRDGKKLFTTVYQPTDVSKKHPIRMTRTPYSCSPYGENRFLTPKDLNRRYAGEGYILVWQDVRGRFMSEGNFTDMTPLRENNPDSIAVDESTDAYDTIEWLINNIPNNNGKVGIWGSSYPGFYTMMAGINPHPNLCAIVPQAPIADWFIGDDMHHNGAFTFQMATNFFASFGIPRDSLTTTWPKRFEAPSPDAYNFFLKIGAVKNINEKYFHHNIPIWEALTQHHNYDTFWQIRNTLPHLTQWVVPTLLVGGWYDAEDFYGTIQSYKKLASNTLSTHLSLVIGPWAHSTWNYVPGDKFGDISLPTATAAYYRDSVEFPFFNFYLNGVGTSPLPKSYLYDTGEKVWSIQHAGSITSSDTVQLFLTQNNKLDANVHDESYSYSYISDPAKPVPYSGHHTDSRGFYYQGFMNEDQRFAAQRPDVVCFESDAFDEKTTIQGPVQVTVFVSTTGSDADWVVKLIDVFPDTAKNPEINPGNVKFGGYQMLLRADIFRGKYRNSYSKPEPFIPGEVTKISFALQDIWHTIQPGHKIMVQVQSSWFPLFDRNPQKFCTIYTCNDSDFTKQTHTIYCGNKTPSGITITVRK